MLGIKLLARDWRGGDLIILLMATALAVAIVTGIGMFAERLGNAIVAQSSQLLGADLIMESPRPVETQWWPQIDGIDQSYAVSFATMLSAGDGFQIASLRAVDSAYPLRGNIKISRQLFGDVEETNGGPQVGNIWADSRVLQALGVEVGDSLEIGDTSLRIDAVLVSEPGGNNTGFAPGALMHKDDLAAARVILPGSRVRYYYYFTGETESVAAFQQALTPKLLPEHRIYGVKEGRPRVAGAIDKAESYLMLGGTLGLVLAGAAIAIAARRYTLEQEGVVAVLKTLGTSSNRIVALYSQQLAGIALLSVGVGWGVGWFLQWSIAQVVSQVMLVELAAASFRPLVAGGVTGLVCLAAFAAPPLLGLRKISPVIVLRREAGQAVGSVINAWLIGGTALFGLMVWYTSDLLLAGLVFAGLLLTAILVGACAWLLLRTTHWAGMQAGSVWRLATASLRRRALENSIQVVIFSITLMLFLVLVILRSSLLQDWQEQLPEGTPNHFLVNVSPAQMPEVKGWLSENALEDEGLYPMVRARMTHVNGELVKQRVSKDGDDTASMDREINLTWAAAMPSDNILLEGEWWQANTVRDEVSLESTLALRLGIVLGDSLRFQLADQSFEAQVSSLREVDWERMRPNFYMIFPAHVLESYPATYITSFYLPTENKSLLVDFVRRFPTVTVFEVDAIIAQVRIIVAQVSMAIEAVLWLVIACGGLVLMATIRASLSERLRESAILRTLGAQTRLIMGGLAIEFILLGLVAGVLGAAGAELVGALVQIYSFDMEYSPQPIVWLLGPVAGMVLIGGLGVLASRKVVRQPPLLVLRELE
ncbi:MAG: FtsX-like permease family protein [Pseudomonadales bacterium]